MWSLATHFPAFAYVFSDQPHMWMDWVFRPGGFEFQRRDVQFAISLWDSMHRKGRPIPVTVHTFEREVFGLDNLVALLPPPVRSYIRGLSIRISRSSYLEYDITSFLSRVPNVRHLSLSIMGNCPGPFGRGPVTFLQHTPNPTYDIALTSLSFRNILVPPSMLSEDRWSMLTVLRLDYYRPLHSAVPPIYTILFITPSLTELTVHVRFGLGVLSRKLFELSHYSRYLTWTPRLEFVDVQGDRLCVSHFVSSLLRHSLSSIQSVKITYNCESNEDEDDDIFGEIPLFVEALRGWSDCIGVHADEVSVCLSSEQPRTGVRQWVSRWKLYDWWDSNWVSYRPEYIVYTLLIVQSPRTSSWLSRINFGYSSAIPYPPMRPLSSRSWHLVRSLPCLRRCRHLAICACCI